MTPPDVLMQCGDKFKRRERIRVKSEAVREDEEEGREGEGNKEC